MDKKENVLSIVILSSPLVLLIVALNILLFLTNKTITPLILIIFSIITLALFSISLFLYLKYLNIGLSKIVLQLENIKNGDFTVRKKEVHKKLLQFNSFNNLIEKLKSDLAGTVLSIETILSGNMNGLEDDLDENNIIGGKLKELKENLKKSTEELEKNKLEEEKRNWTSTGLAKFSDVLRQDNDDLATMSYKLISNIVEYLYTNQGALYVLNDDIEDEQYYEPAAAVAYERRKLIENKIHIGEGLIGRCAFEKKTIYLTDIPQGYLNITSGLGEASPSNLILVPCMLDGKIFGVIEIASFNLIHDYQIEFIEKLGESIASTISNTRTRLKTNTLLIESKKYSEELASQEEELRQNLEEMETTQEDLKRQMAMNIEMRKELNYEKFLFDTLLEKIPSRIVFKDKDCKFVKASESAVKKFGKTNYSEIVGLSDADLLDAKFAEKTMFDEKHIMKSREGKVNFIEHEVTDKGEDMYKTVSKIPLIDEDDNCVGIFGIMTDITNFKLTEIEGEKCKNNYKKLTDFIDNYLISFKLDEQGNLTHANNKLCDLFGIKLTEIEGESADKIFSQYLKPEDLIIAELPTIMNNDSITKYKTYNISNKKVEVVENYLVLEAEKDKKEILMIGLPVK